MIRRWMRRLVVWALGNDPDLLAALAVQDKAALKRMIDEDAKRIDELDSNFRKIRGYLAEKAQEPKRRKRR